MKDLTDKEFGEIRDYIKANFGINLGDEKKSLVYSRLRSVLVENGMDDFSQYFNYLINDKSGEAVVRFIDRITTNHTFFMRETDHFDYLKNTVLPFIEKNAKDHDLRLWCAAASSGEEPYTLKFIVEDYFRNNKDRWNTEILATDISSNALDKAVRGLYPDESVDTLPEVWRKAYFDKSENGNRMVKEEIKRGVTYRKFNLMEERFPFKKKFHVIFCRNVMIYFDNQTRDKLVKKCYDITEPGGYLFIGHSESLSHSATEYQYVMPAVYRKAL